MAELSKSDMRQRLAELDKANELLESENTLLQAHLEKAGPIQQKLSESDGRAAGRRRKAQAETQSGLDPGGLDISEKNDIATAELEVLQSENQRIQEDSVKELNQVRVDLEEMDERIADAKKDMYDFRRDIIEEGQDPRTGKTIAEKMVKYLEDRIRSKDTMIEKLRLKNANLKAQTHKLELQLLHKEDMGEMLHGVDFDQLKIENKQQQEKLDTRNLDLLKHKNGAGRAVQALADHKKRLQANVDAGQTMVRQIEERRGQLGRFAGDWAAACKARGAAAQQLQQAKDEQQDREQPEIMDYIRLKAAVTDLEKKVVDWERKNEIAEMDLARTQKLMTKLPSLKSSKSFAPLGTSIQVVH
ncbi:hypothetical protein WJX84_000755 [Apatococcus fuscideae]|uniref:Cilia- and flagella-associated protein 263 n=1 Tax=Apatococcus fuscideae TaxID=2026836 RepID=A0AAW1TBH5_9CHLO